MRVPILNGRGLLGEPLDGPSERDFYRSCRSKSGARHRSRPCLDAALARGDTSATLVQWVLAAGCACLSAFAPAHHPCSFLLCARSRRLVRVRTGSTRRMAALVGCVLAWCSCLHFAKGCRPEQVGNLDHGRWHNCRLFACCHHEHGHDSRVRLTPVANEY
jgi:hypothetical protein